MSLVRMVARKRRMPVVLDTNVFVRAFKGRFRHSSNRRVVRLWLIEKRLQLIVSQGLIHEYLRIFEEVVGVSPEVIRDWQARFEDDPRSTFVNLGRRYTESRDPDDNLLLATAAAGAAKYLVTNDRDLLELPKDVQQKLPFLVVTPAAFLRVWESA